jgi:hypothetical protein
VKTIRIGKNFRWAKYVKRPDRRHRDNDHLTCDWRPWAIISAVPTGPYLFPYRHEEVIRWRGIKYHARGGNSTSLLDCWWGRIGFQISIPKQNEFLLQSGSYQLALGLVPTNAHVVSV